MGAIIGVEDKIKKGDVMGNWEFPVEVLGVNGDVEVEPLIEPNLNALPMLNVKPYNLQQPREPKNIYI